MRSVRNPAFIFCLTVILFIGLASNSTAQQTAPATALAPGPEVETVVFLRHGEKPKQGDGNLTPQGLNRALALSLVLPKKFGKPDFLFAPDPSQQVNDPAGPCYYVRPLATIEPTAIKLEMPVQTPFGYREIDKLNDELSKPRYSHAVIFVAWEHLYAAKAAANLFKQFGGDPSQVPDWPGKDYDSLYVLKITRIPGAATTATFTHEREGLDGQSREMPSPAAK